MAAGNKGRKAEGPAGGGGRKAEGPAGGGGRKTEKPAGDKGGKDEICFKNDCRWRVSLKKLAEYTELNIKIVTELAGQ